jgi:hypothetical protein
MSMTAPGLSSGDAVLMTLDRGDEIRCPNCRRWHSIEIGATEGTPDTLTMLYFTCGGLRYYAGSIGTPSRHPARRPAIPADIAAWMAAE